MTAEIKINNAQESDFPAIQKIYAHYVLNSTSSLEEKPPGIDEMLERWRDSTDKSLPYLIAKINNIVVGYAYVFPYRQRSSYRFTIEESVYISPQYTGHGIGKKLLNEIINICSEQGYKQMLAIIAGSENLASIKLHKKMGFTQCGTIKNAGFKHTKWIDTVLMQRSL